MESEKLYQCRLCMKRTAKKMDVFKQDFPKMIYLLSGIQADYNDGLPRESCLDCAKDVKFCMSIRKQIIQSYKTLKLLLAGQETKMEPQQTTIEKTEHLVPRKRRSMTPDSTTDDDVLYEQYGSSDNDESERHPDSKAESVVEEEITLITEPYCMNGNAEEVTSENETKQENVEEEVEAKCEGIEEGPRTRSAKNLLRKRNMLAASNRILQQGDPRYSRVLFVRKSRREKTPTTTDPPIPKRNKHDEDQSKIIWRNGKKHVACEICKKEVKKHYLKNHMAIHFPEHFSCDICGVTTRNLRGLSYHKLYWHSSKLDYICDKCGKKYRSKHALELHNKKEHGGVRDLECNICGKKFFQKMHLKRHVDGIHAKLRPHKCEYCGKDFTKRTHLVTHWRTHTNETPFACDMCGERFKLKLSLKNHLRRAHNYVEKEKVFCPICNRGFASEIGLRAHINSRVHEGEKCQYCSESFTPEYLKKHLREVHFHEEEGIDGEFQ
ncbi:zinc finger protein 436-like [Anthonomus grandis grandis]|uniref:zinc finger protein 436-like n=1 Tax=Anthonomus grandis grandis TaxID=2921223 RepID=UPI0021658593|nr:zinc finger protein 436-like [Anthonomus grandis grandis]